MRQFKPYAKGYFPVPGGHELYYERYGNPRGIPTLFLHGGPGAGFSDRDKRFFDPKKFNVLLFDQRGAGRSKPFASLKGNNTHALVGDICRLLDHFGLKKVFVFGGSWGSTLSLVFAISHPERVSGLLVRGIFLGDAKSIAHYLKGGVSDFFPKEWERFIDFVPRNKRHDIIGYYLRQMRGKNAKQRNKACYEWARYEMSILRLEMSEEEIANALKDFSYRSLAVLEAHYLKHGCFLSPGFILRGAHRLAKIPTSIVHGRYDFICAPRDAYALKDKLPGARFFIVCAGHSAREPAIENTLIAETKRFAKILQKGRNYKGL